MTTLKSKQIAAIKSTLFVYNKYLYKFTKSNIFEVTISNEVDIQNIFISKIYRINHISTINTKGKVFKHWTVYLTKLAYTPFNIITIDNRVYYIDRSSIGQPVQDTLSLLSELYFNGYNQNTEWIYISKYPATFTMHGNIDDYNVQCEVINDENLLEIKIKELFYNKNSF